MYFCQKEKILPSHKNRLSNPLPGELPPRGDRRALRRRAPVRPLPLRPRHDGQRLLSPGPVGRVLGPPIDRAAAGGGVQGQHGQAAPTLQGEGAGTVLLTRKIGKANSKLLLVKVFYRSRVSDCFCV